jgi:hypothetical protein
MRTNEDLIYKVYPGELEELSTNPEHYTRFNLEETIGLMKEAQKEIVAYALDEVNKLQKMKFNCGETGYLDTESRSILKDELIKEIDSL